MKKQNVRSIGIAGSIRGCGVTHLSVALANYAASGLNERTAYFELGGHGELAHWKMKNAKGFFSDLGIAYYPNVRSEQVPILLNQGYEKIIMDFGDEYLRYREELLRCDRKVFLLNLNPWQMYAAEKLVEAVRDQEWGNIEPVYAGRKMHLQEKKRIEKKYRIQILEIPDLPNARCVPESVFGNMENLLDSVTNRKRKKSLIPIKRNY